MGQRGFCSPSLCMEIVFYVHHDGYNSQPYHDDLISYIIVLQKVPSVRIACMMS